MTQDMGLGELEKSSLVFARKFRFNLAGDHLDSIFTSAVEVDYTDKLITIKLMELVDISVDKTAIVAHQWADAMEQKAYPEEVLTLTTYDGCGNELYRNTFHQLTLIGRKNKYDYKDNEVCETELVISYRYRNYERGRNETHKCMENPNIDRTTEINHLNAKTWIP